MVNYTRKNKKGGKCPCSGLFGGGHLRRNGAVGKRKTHRKSKSRKLTAGKSGRSKL